MGHVLTLEEREAVLAKVRGWLADGRTWIGGFENADLGHPDLGRRLILPYDDDVYEHGRIGHSTAPDSTTIGLGWRYLLDLKTRDAAEAARWLLRDDSN